MPRAEPRREVRGAARARRGTGASLLAGFLALASPAAALVQPLPDWMNRLHLGGSAAVRYQAGQSRAQLDHNGGFAVQEAGLVVDVDLGSNLSFWYDFALVREGVSRSAVPGLTHEQAYIRWDQALGRSWLNGKAGRAFTPFGEEYLRWNSIDSPFASRSVAFPWALDEGLVVFGDLLPEERLSYAASVQNGNQRFNGDDNPNKAFAAQLIGRPAPWLRLTGSCFDTGKLGTNTSVGVSEFWLSGIQIMPLGQTSAASGPSPSKIVEAQAYEVDAALQFGVAQAWARAGYVRVQDGGGSAFDRHIRYLTTEVLGRVPMTERRGYLAARFSVIGTFSPDLGYAFAGTEVGFNGLGNNSAPYSRFGYDQRELRRVTLAAGWDVRPGVRVKAEYSWERSLLIEPAKTPANMAVLGNRDFLIAEVAVRF